MITALALMGYTIVAAVLGPRLLAHADWPCRLPILGIAAWLILVANVVSGAVLAVLAATVGLMRLSMDTASLLHICAAGMTSAIDGLPHDMGSVAAVGAAVLAAVRIVGVSWRRARQRRRDREVLDTIKVISRREDRLGVRVLEHGSAYAFCLPGRHGGPVITAGALDLLSPHELGAVIAHERGHQRHLHHRIVDVFDFLAALTHELPPFGIARDQARRLVELDADNFATRHAPRQDLTAALSRLAGAGADLGIPALAAADRDIAERVTRLAATTRPTTGSSLRATCVVLLGAAAPVALLAAPAVIGIALGLCS